MKKLKPKWKIGNDSSQLKSGKVIIGFGARSLGIRMCGFCLQQNIELFFYFSVLFNRSFGIHFDRFDSRSRKIVWFDCFVSWIQLNWIEFGGVRSAKCDDQINVMCISALAFWMSDKCYTISVTFCLSHIHRCLMIFDTIKSISSRTHAHTRIEQIYLSFWFFSLFFFVFVFNLPRLLVRLTLSAVVDDNVFCFGHLR